MPYRTITPGEKASSPASARATLKVRNEESKTGKFSIKIGSGQTEQESITHGNKKEYDVKDKSFVLINKGDVDLEWLRD